MQPNEEIRRDLKAPALALRELIPDVMKSFAALSASAMAPGELSVGQKELLALVIATTKECDGCIVAHARGVARNGISRQVVAEAIGVVVLMNGGPGTVWGPRALAAYDQAILERQ
jgi:AhpD family alkylhydroperoxidase